MLKQKSYLSKKYWNNRYFVLRTDNTLEYYQKLGDDKCKASFAINRSQGCQVSELFARKHKNELIYCIELSFANSVNNNNNKRDDRRGFTVDDEDDEDDDNSSAGGEDLSRGDLSRASAPVEDLDSGSVYRGMNALSPRSASARVLSPFKKSLRKRELLHGHTTPPRTVTLTRSLDADNNNNNNSSTGFGSRLRHRRPHSSSRVIANDDDAPDSTTGTTTLEYPHEVEVEYLQQQHNRPRMPPFPPLSASSTRKQKLEFNVDALSTLTPVISNHTNNPNINGGLTGVTAAAATTNPPPHRPRTAYEEEQDEEQDFLRTQFLTTQKQSQRKTKQMMVQGSQLAAAAGATVGLTVLTSGIGLVAGLVALGVAGAAGGSVSVVNSTLWRRNKGAGSIDRIILASADYETAKRWQAILDAALESDVVQQSTWGQLFASDNGRKARAVLLPGEGKRDSSYNGTNGGAVTSYWGHNARWTLIEGGLLSIVCAGFQGLRIYREEREGDCCKETGTQRYAQLSVAGKPCSPMKAHITLSSSPLDAFLCLMSHGRIATTSPLADGYLETERRASFEVIESIDEHTDVIHLTFHPLFLFPSWTIGRDFVLYRYWRLEPDGSYVVCFESVEHPMRPPSTSYVRGEMHSVFTIAPLKRALRRRAMKQNLPLECLMTATVQLDPKGWVPTAQWSCFSNQAYGDAFGINALLQLVDIQEAIDLDRFVAVAADRGLHNSVQVATADDFPSFDLQSSIPHGITRNVSTDTNDEIVNEDFVNYDFAYAANESRVEIPETATGINARPLPLTTKMWAEPDSNSFRVRGMEYKHDKLKCNAGPSVGRLIAVDVVSVDKPLYSGFSVHPTERIQLALQKERDLKGKGLESDMPPFIFVVNIVLPGPPFYHGVYYYAISDMSTIDGSDGTPSSLLCQKFFFGDCDEFRDRTFKLIPQIVDGNFIVRKCVGSTPAIMGKKLRQLYVSNDRFFEVILDCGSSPVATGVIRLSLGYAKTLVVDMGFLFEGDEDEYLPERIFGCVRMKNIDFGPQMRHVVAPTIGLDEVEHHS